MSSERRFEFTKNHIDTYLKALARAYRRRAGKHASAELILIGGAAVLMNYGFRNMTTDVDALIRAASAIKDAIHDVSNAFHLPNGWLNDDFRRTDSYTPKLVQFSVFYRTYLNTLTVRTVSSAHLIAMKLRSGRPYKSDLSDVLGILAAHEQQNAPLSMPQIRQAVFDLYGSWSALPEHTQSFIEMVMQSGRFSELYAETISDEQAAKHLLMQAEQNAPDAVHTMSSDDIIRLLKERQKRPLL